MERRVDVGLVKGTAAVVLIAATLSSPLGRAATQPAVAGVATWPSMRVNCAHAYAACPDVYDPYKAFDHYVGHDEPALLFYSKQPGSGNHMTYTITLPTDPVSSPPTGTDNFQLHVAFWFGMVLCATMSYPEQLSTCTPDSDSNIVNPKKSPLHPGAAYMEMQFYPPGWAPFQLSGGISCDAVKWCAALTVTSYASDPVNGTALNPTCAAKVGVEYQNFAFVTLSGKSQAPANPIDATSATYTPDPSKDLFMSPGDKLSVSMHDTADGLKITVADLTSGQTGYMTSSLANGFGQVKYAPAPSTECVNVPYSFRPMYSTSSEQTWSMWTAQSYGVAFSDEIGHFDYCAPVNTSGACTGREGIAGDKEPTDTDDAYCFPASQSLLVPVSGCGGSNLGFDGTPYQPDWPDGNTSIHATPYVFSSPLTGANDSVNYSSMAFETDTPLIEGSTPQGCNYDTGAHCSIVPQTDDGVAASFYPFYADARQGRGCVWTLGNDIPGFTLSDFGKDYQYGRLLKLTYTNGSGTRQIFEDYRERLSPNPCVSA